MAKHFDPWSVLVCHRINESEEDQQALRELVQELEKNRLWEKDRPTIKTRSYYREYFYRRRSLATKRQRELIKKVGYE